MVDSMLLSMKAPAGSRRILGWEPKVSLERGLRSVIESMR